MSPNKEFQTLLEEALQDPASFEQADKMYRPEPYQAKVLIICNKRTNTLPS